MTKEDFERKVASVIAIQPDPVLFVQETVEHGNKIVKMLDDILEEFNQDILKDTLCPQDSISSDTFSETSQAELEIEELYHL